MAKSTKQPRKKQEKASALKVAETGRPTVMTEETLQKLEGAFLLNLTDEMACLYADISASTLYNYQTKHPEFLERKTLLKANIKMRARVNVARNVIAGNIDDSKWVLERTDDEFKPKQNIAIDKSQDSIDFSKLTDAKLMAYADAADDTQKASS